MNPKLFELINKAQSLVVLPHIKPDGDAFGSSLAFCHAMKEMGKDCVIHASESLPDYLSFLEDESIRVVHEPIGDFDLQVVLDSADVGRVEDRYNPELTTILIDHHRTNVGFGDAFWIEPDASSTGEMIYSLIKELGVNFTTPIMEALYTAVVLDTGRFYYSSTRSSTLRLVADFIDLGLNTAELNFKIYGEESLEKKKLFSLAISKLESEFDGYFRYVLLPKEATENMDSGSTEGLVESLRDIKGTEVALLIYYYNNQWKGSLRSKGIVNVIDIAATFGGGGHAQASGFTLKEEPKVVIDKIRHMVRR